MHEYHISSSGFKYADLSAVQVNDFSAVDIRSEHNYEEDKTRFGQIKIDWLKYLTASWQLNTSLGLQSSEFSSPVHDKVSLMPYGQDFSFDLRPNDRIAVNHYGFDITDPQQWQLYSLNKREDEVPNQYRVASAEFIFDDGGSFKHFLAAVFRAFLMFVKKLNIRLMNSVAQSVISGS